MKERKGGLGGEGGRKERGREKGREGGTKGGRDKGKEGWRVED